MGLAGRLEEAAEAVRPAAGPASVLVTEAAWAAWAALVRCTAQLLRWDAATQSASSDADRHLHAARRQAEIARAALTAHSADDPSCSQPPRWPPRSRRCRTSATSRDSPGSWRRCRCALSKTAAAGACAHQYQPGKMGSGQRRRPGSAVSTARWSPTRTSCARTKSTLSAGDPAYRLVCGRRWRSGTAFAGRGLSRPGRQRAGPAAPPRTRRWSWRHCRSPPRSRATRRPAGSGTAGTPGPVPAADLEAQRIWPRPSRECCASVRFA